MRIIGGSLKRKKLESPRDGSTTRPMPDRVRQAVFNLLRGHCEGAVVCDVFAGTGAIGFEALSRGAERCVFIERDKNVWALIERNASMLGVADRCRIVRADATGPLAVRNLPEEMHRAFLDPPYPLVRDRSGWEQVRSLAAAVVARLDDTGFMVLRTPWPFLHDAERPRLDLGPGTGPGAGRDAKPAAAERVEIDLDDPGADEAFEAFERELERAAVEAAARAGVKREPGNLEIEGAEGPETHAYGTTAVHLYMRLK